MRTAFAIAVAVALVALALANSATAPPKPVWADSWDAPFGLNVNVPPYKVHNESSHYYYAWNLNRSSLITYPLGCLPMFTQKPCNLLFNDVGVTLIVPDEPCCVLFPGVGTIPPDFLKAFTWNGTEHAPNMYGNLIQSNFWRSEAGFLYWTSVKTGIDVRVRDGPESVFWNYGTVSFRAQDPKRFVSPPNCAAQCNTSSFVDASRVARLGAALAARYNAMK